MEKYKGLFSLLLFLFGCYIGTSLAKAQEPVKLAKHDDQINVTIGGKSFTTYYFSPREAKPYLMPLRSAEGTVVTRPFPVGDTIPPEHVHDRSIEPHQRPMYFAHGNIDGIDFWSEKVFNKQFYHQTADNFGRTVFEKLNGMRSGPHSGEVSATFNLVGPRGRVLGEETQSYTFRGGPDTRVIDCQFVIRATHGPVKMEDTKEGTFAIRVAAALNSPPGRMVSSTGGVGEPQIWGKRADWVDYDGAVAGEDLGIAIFDSPRSFRHPTYWHARAYGLFAANPFGIREFTKDPGKNGSYTIPPGRSLTFRYRVFIHHGDYKQAHVAEAYQRYAAEESR
ncbi:MAG: PmoA family protein [Terriglobia bacterium]